MQCDNCGAVNPANSRFCGHCGRQLAASPITCPRCYAQVAPGRFSCVQCGRPVVPPVLAEQPAEESPVAPPVEHYGEDALVAGQLSPRDLGDLIGETLRLYRQRLWLFLGIALIAQVPGLLSLAFASLTLEIILAIVGFAVFAVAQGATIYAVAGYYLGLPISLGICFGRARQQAVSLVVTQLIFAFLASICLALAIMAPLFVLIGIPLFFALLVLLGFYPQTVMLEQQTPLLAFRRSAIVVHGDWFRVFGIWVTYALILVAVAVLPVILASAAGATVRTVIINLVLVAGMPWLIIGRTLLYFDLRIRKEGFTLEVLNSELGFSRNLDDTGNLRG